MRGDRRAGPHASSRGRRLPPRHELSTRSSTDLRSTRGSWRQIEHIIAHRGGAKPALAVSADAMRFLKRRASRTARSQTHRQRAARGARGRRARRAPGLQARRHLRAEFATQTAYMYSTYETERRQCRADPKDRKKIMVWAAAQPHRPGHRVRLLLRARRARLREDGLRDHHGQLQPGDRVDRLRHLGPPVLRAGDAGRRAGNRRQGEAGRRDRAVRRPDAAEAGARPRSAPACRSSAPARTASTWPKTASASSKLLHELGLRQPPNRTARTGAEARAANDRLPAGGAAELRAGRPRDGDRHGDLGPGEAPHARGGAGVGSRRCCWTASSTTRSRSTSTASPTAPTPGRRDHRRHHGTRRAGRHPTPATRPARCRPLRSPKELQDEMRRQTTLMARALKVKVGLMNVQFAIQGDTSGELHVYVLEVNPRASRTVPFVSKATGPLAKIAALLHGRADARHRRRPRRARSCPPYFSVRKRCSRSTSSPAWTPSSAPEMRSTGEVMGAGATFGETMLKEPARRGFAPAAQGHGVHHGEEWRQEPCRGVAAILAWFRWLHQGRHRRSPRGRRAGEGINKGQGRPAASSTWSRAGEIQLVFTTVDETRTAIADSRHIRQAALATG